MSTGAKPYLYRIYYGLFRHVFMTHRRSVFCSLWDPLDQTAAHSLTRLLSPKLTPV